MKYGWYAIPAIGLGLVAYHEGLTMVVLILAALGMVCVLAAAAQDWLKRRK